MDRESADVLALLAADINLLETRNLALHSELLIAKEMLSEALEIAHQALARILAAQRR